MPGFTFAYQTGNTMGDPRINTPPLLAADSMTGTGTPPAAVLQAGDLVCLSNASGITSNTTTVARMLLAADKTAHYKQGSNVVGVYGVAASQVTSNSTGGASGPFTISTVTNGSAIQYPYSTTGAYGPELVTGRCVVPTFTGTSSAVFTARIDMNATDWPSGLTLSNQFNQQQAGVILNTTSGVTTYTVQPITGSGGISTNGAAAQDCFLIILGPVVDDPLYDTLVASAAATGPLVYVQFLGAFQQSNTGFVYTSQ